MKLSVRQFVIGCVLIGAIAVPWAWRAYHERRFPLGLPSTASRNRLLQSLRHLEIKALRAELGDLYQPRNEAKFKQQDGLHLIERRPPTPKEVVRIRVIRKRLEVLTGNGQPVPDWVHESVRRQIE